MSHSRCRQKPEGRRERLANNTTVFGGQDVESTNIVSSQTDKDCDSGRSTGTNLHIQRSDANSEKGLGGDDSFIERNQDIMTSTLEWRRRVLRSQEATQATTSSRQPHTINERRYASSEIEIERIEEHYRKQEEILEEEIKKHKEMHEQAIEELKTEEKCKEGYGYAADWWGVRPGSDYQPTECGD